MNFGEQLCHLFDLDKRIEVGAYPTIPSIIISVVIGILIDFNRNLLNFAKYAGHVRMGVAPKPVNQFIEVYLHAK